MAKEKEKERAFASAGSSMAARIAMMAITTKSSINVKLTILFIFVSFLSHIVYWTRRYMNHVQKSI